MPSPRLARLLGLDEPMPESTPADEAAFQARQKEVGYRVWSTAYLGIVLFALLWWPTDRLIFHGRQQVIETFATARWATSLFSLLALLLISHVPFLRARPLGSLAVVGCVNVGFWGYVFGELGGPSMLWFNFLPQLMSAVTVVSFPGTRRVLVSVSFALSMVAGYFGLHPQYFLDPYAPAVLSCLGCSVLAFSGVGLMMDYFRRQAFFLRLATERQAQALATLNGQLEQRVSEQTSELRALTHRLENARESERAHIARELHDELGQELTALRLALKFTRHRYEQGHNVRHGLDELETLLARTTATTRGILTDLRPRVLDDLGFPAAAEWLVERARQRLAIPCTLKLPDEELHLTDEIATTAFRILQEALTNVMRHAQAAAVEVEVRAEVHQIEIVIRDDGVGVESPTTDQKSPGLGLVGMRERARAVGGEFWLEGTGGRGTTVRVRLPRQTQAVREVA